MSDMLEPGPLYGSRGYGWRSVVRGHPGSARLNAAPLYGSLTRGLRLARRAP